MKPTASHLAKQNPLRPVGESRLKFLTFGMLCLRAKQKSFVVFFLEVFEELECANLQRARDLLNVLFFYFCIPPFGEC